MKKFFLISFFLLQNSFAQQIEFGELTYEGTGCPDGTLTSVVSPDGASLSILFDQFMVEVPSRGAITGPTRPGRNAPTRATGQHEDHKTCHLKFKATLPEGVMATHLEVNVQARGSAVLDQGIQAYLSTILLNYHGLAQYRRVSPTVLDTYFLRSVRKPIDENWVRDQKAEVAINSECSRSGNKSIQFELRNHLNAEIINRDLMKSGLVMVDSNDMNGQLKISLRTKRCGGTSSPLTKMKR